jgi:hypothetical protein
MRQREHQIQQSRRWAATALPSSPIRAVYAVTASCGGFAKDKRGKWRPYGMTKQIIDKTGDTKNAKSLAHATYAAIRKTLPRSAAVLDFLGDLVDACPDGVLRWTSALGATRHQSLSSPHNSPH